MRAIGKMVAVPTAERGLASSATYLPTKADPKTNVELVTNGGFDTDLTDWTDGSTGGGTATVSSGAVTLSSGASYVSDRGIISQTISDLTVGKTYALTVVTGAGSTGRIDFSSILSASDLPASSTTTFFVTADATTELVTMFSPLSNNVDCVVDNISVKELRYDPSAARYLPRIGHHKYDSTTAKWNAHNLLTYSEFDAAVPTDWSVGFATGTYTHTLGTELFGIPTITHEQTVSGRSYLAQNLSVTGGVSYTFTVFVDVDNSEITSGSNVIMYIADSPTAAANLGDADASGRITITYTPDADGSADFRVGLGCTGNATGTIVFAAPHLYRSDLNGVVANSGNSVSGLYVPTTATATEPTLNTEVSYQNKGLRHESEARTNLVPDSNDFSTNFTTTGSPTITSGQPNNLTGEADATSFEATITGDTKITHDSIAHTTVNHSMSVFAKKSSGSGWLLMFGVGQTNSGVWFNLNTGTIGTEQTAGIGSIKDFGDGWYQCSINRVVNGATTQITLEPVSADNASTAVIGDTILFFGLQYELGDTPSSYIPTYGATATRAAETFDTPAGTAPWSGISNTTVRREADYVSGYLPTDTKGAWLSDTDDTDVTGSVLDDDFSSYADTAALQAVWSSDATGTATLSGTDLVLTTDVVGTPNDPYTWRSFATVIGQQYYFTATINCDDNGQVLFGGSENNGAYYVGATGSGARTVSGYFTPTATTTFFTLRARSTTVSNTATLSDVSVKLADGVSD